MEAKLRNSAVCLLLSLLGSNVLAATVSSTNFVVTAPSEEIARKVAKCAEVWREDLAIQWLGETLPNWYKPCPIEVKVGQIGAGGSTTFTFDNGEVFGWKMKVQGTLERILDSVIPHEVNHTIFACYFRRPVPRWADEGAATLFEHPSEQAHQERTLKRVLNTGRRIPLQQLFTIKEYPSDHQDVMTLYAEGFFLARYLVEQKGKLGRTTYLKFLEDAHQHGWQAALKKHYGYEGIQNLESEWKDWIVAGSPDLSRRADELLASNSSSTAEETTVAYVDPPKPEAVVRLQSPDEKYEPLAMIPRARRTTSMNRQSQNVTAEMHQHAGNSLTEIPKTNPENTQIQRVRGDAGDSRLRYGEEQLIAPPLPRDSLSPTADGIFGNTASRSYQFPRVRAF